MKKKSLAIIGAGSSGLITLKTALDSLSNWEIQCFERSSNVRGCWGNPYKGFISTSTKFTTQFNCHIKYDATVSEDSSQYHEFFKDGEYGDYLEDFAKTYHLHKLVQLNTEVSKIRRTDGKWTLEFSDAAKQAQIFTHIIVCTGLTESPKEVHSTIPTLYNLREISSLRKKTVVVMGGGESAADTANRLARPELKNTVYLSLKRGIRVSPRYHPIRGVPSDFLRTRLMLSIRAGLRNKIGQKFVESRIRYRRLFERVFPHGGKRSTKATKDYEEVRRYWDMLLTQSAKDQLFNMFHNKSDGFLDAVSEGRIKIIGPPTDGTLTSFKKFQQDSEIVFTPDILIPKLGFQSRLSTFFEPSIHVSDFYMGCIHKEYENVFLVGFARPVIGNIPTIAEQQANYIIKLLKGSLHRQPDIISKYKSERERLAKQFPMLNLKTLYPVEMFPYCDVLAKEMGVYPSLKKVGSLYCWLKIILSPASTMHYLDENHDSRSVSKLPIHSPVLINLLLILVKLLDRSWFSTSKEQL